MKMQLHINISKLPEEAVLLLKKTIALSACCFFILTNTIQAQQITVWPGDANNDGIVNNLDILPIGVAFGKQGISRDSISFFWQENITLAWQDSLSTGIDVGHVDCSGNGMINIEDVLGIESNYGEINSSFNGLQFQNGTLNDPRLSIITNQSIWLPGDTVSVTIFLSQNAADSIYNIAFTFAYDTALIRESSVDVKPHPQFGGGGRQPIYVEKNFPANGFVEFGISRTNNKNHGGDIAVAVAGFIIEDNLIGKSFLDVNDAFFVEKIRLHDSALNNLPVMGDTIDAKVSTVVPEKKLQQWVKVYPVPSAQNIYVDFTDNIFIEQLMLIDMDGRLSEIDFNLVGNSAKLNIGSVPNGVYTLKIITDNGVMHERIIVRK